jgi:hypothetical protein
MKTLRKLAISLALMGVVQRVSAWPRQLMRVAPWLSPAATAAAARAACRRSRAKKTAPNVSRAASA